MGVQIVHPFQKISYYTYIRRTLKLQTTFRIVPAKSICTLKLPSTKPVPAGPKVVTLTTGLAVVMVCEVLEAPNETLRILSGNPLAAAVLLLNENEL